jgi:hypothetical protein
LNCAEQKTNPIDNIGKESIGAGEIPDTIVAQNVVETCMNLTYIHLSSALAQSTFIALLPTNVSYKKYYEECTSAKKQEVDTIHFRTAIMDIGSVCRCSLI